MSSFKIDVPSCSTNAWAQWRQKSHPIWKSSICRSKSFAVWLNWVRLNQALMSSTRQTMASAWCSILALPMWIRMNNSTLPMRCATFHTNQSQLHLRFFWLMCLISYKKPPIKTWLITFFLFWVILWVIIRRLKKIWSLKDHWSIDYSHSFPGFKIHLSRFAMPFRAVPFKCLTALIHMLPL